MPTKSIWEGIISRLIILVFTMESDGEHNSSNNWYIPFSILSFSKPSEEVAFDWGSRSISKTFFSNTAKHEDKLTAVVVFPTPPFWLDIAIVFAFYFNK